ncbi:guanitoxin biosynthesis MBL fold metallo-hydrolase GntH [uncultured Microbulbifer sp.]|uniref:guanitoxin biosynthesis MBL fold metallo-hydrolase GntH n=1 Tax=uncultured Microbulbifer sp. TaxID=348147 RepID=UPI002609CBF0|nr:guanitoxin biosynthesis MBL fold metallo-hydrolase GntH [uncultured Microbulbifer sp.]
MNQHIRATLYILTVFAAHSHAESPTVNPPTESQIKDYLSGNPNDHSGLHPTHSHKGYQQFDFNTIDIEKLKQKKGKLYSSEEEIRRVLSGGVNNPTGEKQLWKEGLMFQGIEPMEHMISAANWFPRTEKLQPNEMRVTFMGTSPVIRPGQANTSIFVELGNGDNFIFDLGEGSIANYSAAGLALNELTKVFITHLHVDHFGSLPYLYKFGGWNGRWHEPLTVYGPSGSSEEYGTKWMVDGMLKMLNWHTDAFDVFPAGNQIRVVEFDYKDDGGVIYDKDGATVRHWRRSHAKDGASAYRLDWKTPDGENLCFVWTGDGRPSKLDLKYAKGCDLYVTEVQTELLGLSSKVQGVPPFLARYTVDTHHTPGYAAGWLANQIKPILFMTTHMPFDPYLNEETVAQIREFWKGPYHFGAPDGIVVNITPQQAWVREGILPDYPNNRAPQFDMSSGKDFVIPHPRKARKDIQQQEIRDLEVNPDLYYPKGYKPELLTEWPVDSDLVLPTEEVPESMRKGMGQAEEDRARLRKAHGLED